MVGGSRGLGEIAAKLLAAGGADVRLTHLIGAADGKAVANDIIAGGGTAASIQYDVLSPAPMEDWRPTALYYFASPFIFKASRAVFSTTLYDEFCAHYVAGLWKTIGALGGRDSDLRSVFYPSSDVLDDVPLNMGEFAAAKSAGEALCAFVEKAFIGVTVERPRLPRVATDQTASLLAIPTHDPVPVLMRCFRELALQAGPLRPLA